MNDNDWRGLSLWAPVCHRNTAHCGGGQPFEADHRERVKGISESFNHVKCVVAADVSGFQPTDTQVHTQRHTQT